MTGELKKDGTRIYEPVRYTGLPNYGDSVTWPQAFVMDVASIKYFHCPEKEIWIARLV